MFVYPDKPFWLKGRDFEIKIIIEYYTSPLAELTSVNQNIFVDNRLYVYIIL